MMLIYLNNSPQGTGQKMTIVAAPIPVRCDCATTSRLRRLDMIVNQIGLSMTSYHQLLALIASLIWFLRSIDMPVTM